MNHGKVSRSDSVIAVDMQYRTVQCETRQKGKKLTLQKMLREEDIQRSYTRLQHHWRKFQSKITKRWMDKKGMIRAEYIYES